MEVEAKTKFPEQELMERAICRIRSLLHVATESFVFANTLSKCPVPEGRYLNLDLG